ncbi:hypothetical protein AKO1_013623 [Acrasis kona]|uniref:Uncharacterized protein n=1 Tax=Acrasis kona TaxID=1008807 RepID=A0AAW2YV34_9EUKA
MQHDELTESMYIGIKLKKDMQELCRIGFDWIEEEDEFKDKNSKFYHDKFAYAMHHLSFYKCYECGKPYYGGAKQCEANEGQQNVKFDEKELMCGSCVSKKLQLKNGVCPTHGSEYVEFKCRFCCSVAVWFCFGTTHFCDKCHSGARAIQPCLGKGKCPIGGDHPPNGNEHALGCGLCRNKYERIKL